MDQLLPAIISQTPTLGALYRRLRVVREYFEKKFFTQGTEVTIESICEGLHMSTKDQEAIKALAGLLSPVVSGESVSETIETIIKDLSDSSICLTIPIQVPEEAEEQMAGWVREAAGKAVIVEVRVDPEATGGCMIGVGGRYYDFSYTFFFEKKREEVEEVIRNKINKPII